MKNETQASNYDAQKINLDNLKIISNLPTLRTIFDLFSLNKLIKKRGDIREISSKFKINESTLSRAINEVRILSAFPGLSKSKASPLSTMSSNREINVFSKYYDIYDLEVRQLIKKIRKWKYRLEKNPRLLLTPSQHDLIIGSTIGDANIRQRDKNCNFRVGHSKAQEKYLLWKYDILKEFCLSEPKWCIRKPHGKKIKSLELATATHNVFNYYRKLFYNKGIKKVTREALDLLTPRSLAVWLCDDGSFGTSQINIIFCTNSYTLKEHEIMKKYFNEVWGLNPTIGFRDKKYYYLRFNKDDAIKLVKIVKSYVPEVMRYKIGEKNV